MASFIDLYVALVLAGAGLAIFLVLRIGALPRKSLPWLIAGIAGVAGFSIWRIKRANDLKADLERKEKEAREKDKDLAAMKTQLGAENLDLQRIEAEKQKQLETLRRQEESLRQDHQTAVTAIAGASDTETAAAVDAILGGTSAPR
jgi:uncharacterized protein YlxW (UPF0749 family)